MQVMVAFQFGGGACRSSDWIPSGPEALFALDFFSASLSSAKNTKAHIKQTEGSNKHTSRKKTLKPC
jgi:hypothetical protein